MPGGGNPRASDQTSRPVFVCVCVCERDRGVRGRKCVVLANTWMYVCLYVDCKSGYVGKIRPILAQDFVTIENQ